ncbi:MAG: hypothetical protein EAZ92_13285 [Candidatus Kapaibacterium sp.]|nr:MAG: hypothetical protein EAZ92_13285 [Candidatus Kapabacteria bacterium]
MNDNKVCKKYAKNMLKLQGFMTLSNEKSCSALGRKIALVCIFGMGIECIENGYRNSSERWQKASALGGLCPKDSRYQSASELVCVLSVASREKCIFF